ncbi:hypothetical protein ADICYQ_2672 [Cyclobacterium qasimii M12-11B]|uniref:Uncharacterized protein n=1 Tax=Cyclobacterium qasimii M12-11B TaxID=641524 RepID=S7VF99_9BACT|nr:hypothetical protein ADICYQ_2672 [Cyclobacterium qasimii M12-11B]
MNRTKTKLATIFVFCFMLTLVANAQEKKTLFYNFGWYSKGVVRKQSYPKP